MISKKELIDYINRKESKFNLEYHKDDDSVYTKDTGKKLESMDEFLNDYRKLTGQSFESIFYDRISLSNVLKCTECDTVIFSYDDGSYDPNLRCPVCTDYDIHFKYWTKEDINSSISKQKIIESYHEATKRHIEQDARCKRRKGKYDWEIFKIKFSVISSRLYTILECNDITESYFKGLRLHIQIWKKSDNDMYTLKTDLEIPLSISALKYRLHRRKN